MEPQLFWGSKPVVEKFNKVKNENTIVGDMVMATRPKPIGGLWTSTYDAKNNSSDWITWCKHQNHRSCKKSHPTLKKWLLEPTTYKVLTINSHTDLDALVQNYSGIPEGKRRLGVSLLLDFEAMSKDFDAIHLTKEGEHKTRFSFPNSLYGWDCECVLWLNWCFNAVKEV